MLIPDMTLLIAEDDKIQMARYAKFFANNAPNVRLLAALNGRSAYDIILKEKPDAVILDWNMPELDGMELCMILKNNTLTKEIPVIIATSLEHPDDMEYALDNGADDYIKKPFHETELIFRTVRLLELKKKFEEMKSIIEKLKS
jgi:DNA-binding response OmpR family regulator